MIDSFYKEQFIHQPIDITIEEDTLEARAPNGHIVAQWSGERAISINIGNNDYDVRDLVWRIFENESRINALENQVDNLVCVVTDLIARLKAQEGRVF